MAANFRLFDGTNNYIVSKMETRKKQYNEFLEKQIKMAQYKEYHVRSMTIEETAEFMQPLENWNKLGVKRLDGVVSYILKRIYQPEPKLNCVFVLNGQAGSGKSFSGMTLGLLTDDRFDVDSICFSVKEVRDRVEEGRKTLLLDDVETYASSRESLTKLGRFLAKYFDMVRSQRNFFILTSPAFGEIEKILRERSLLRGVCSGIDPINKEVLIRTLFLQKEPDEGKIYRHLPIYWDEKREIYMKLNAMRVKMPPKDLIDAYEDKKNKMFYKLGRSLDKLVDKKDVDDTKTTVRKRPQHEIIYDTMIGEDLSMEETANRLGLTIEQVRMGLVNAKSTGYSRKKINNIC